MMSKARINGMDCVLFYDERVSTEKAPIGFPHIYHVRHDEDNWVCPISIERFVVVNFFGTLFTEVPILFGADGYIEIESFESEHELVEFNVRGTSFKYIFDL